MVMFNVPMADPKQKRIIVKIRNRGSASTLITNLCFFSYDTLISYWFSRPSMTAIITHSFGNYQMPGDLPIGGEWRSMMLQTEEVELLTRSKITAFAVYHSFSEKPLRARVPAIPFNDKKAPDTFTDGD
jgi:hypothetical protein